MRKARDASGSWLRAAFARSARAIGQLAEPLAGVSERVLETRIESLELDGVAAVLGDAHDTRDDLEGSLVAIEREQQRHLTADRGPHAGVLEPRTAQREIAERAVVARGTKLDRD